MPIKYRCEFTIKDTGRGYVRDYSFNNLKDGFWVDDFHSRKICSPLEGNFFIPPSMILYIQREKT